MRKPERLPVGHSRQLQPGLGRSNDPLQLWPELLILGTGIVVDHLGGSKALKSNRLQQDLAGPGGLFRAHLAGNPDQSTRVAGQTLGQINGDRLSKRVTQLERRHRIGPKILERINARDRNGLARHAAADLGAGD